jgi:nucleoside-diphosphate-sugar epimerase
MRVLVTGAQGCIGSWVVRALANRGIDTLIFDTRSDTARLRMIAPEIADRVTVEVGSIEDTSHVKRIVKDGDITHIVHLAAVLMPFCQANPVAGAMVNVIGTLNVFEAARDAGRPVRIAYASSSAVWGPDESYATSGKLTENDPLRPSTQYGVFKQANEGNARAFYLANGISSVGLRPWTVYGVGRDTGLTSDPTLAIRALAAGEHYQVRVTGHMDLQYVEDVAEAFVLSLLSDLEGAHVFNLEGSVIRMDDFIALLDRIRPGAAELVTAQGPQVPVSWRMDGTQLRSKVSGIPSTPLEEGIRLTLQMFTDHIRTAAHG